MPELVLVVGGGERPPDHLKEAAKEAHLLGVDGGARWILRWGLVPARILGDLDSLDERTRTYADGFGAPIEKTPDEVHRSDLARVVDVLVGENPPEVTFTGCVGTRLDHVMALFGGMGRLAVSGVKTRFVERWGTGSVVTPEHPLSLPDLAAERATFMPLTPEVTGLMLSGFDTGDDPPTTLAPPFDGLCGVPIVSDPAEVEVESGAVLVVVPRREGVHPPEPRSKTGVPSYRLGTLERTG
ncbi:MAG: thiamine diphosphokinase [Euryarchaeota archaeon]|nr:thiamine diphosphokinase [Euryarchaeota archaeon]